MVRLGCRKLAAFLIQPSCQIYYYEDCYTAVEAASAIAIYLSIFASPPPNKNKKRNQCYHFQRIPQSRNKFTSRRNKSNYGGHQQQPRKIRRSHKSLKHLPNLRVARGTAGRGCRVQHFFRLGEQPRGREGGSAGLNWSQDKCAKTLD